MFGLTVAREGYRKINLYFDKDSKLLMLATYTVKAEELGGKEVPFEVYYKEYKEVDGAKLPTKLVMKQDGKLFVEATNSDMKAVEKFDEATFGKP